MRRTKRPREFMSYKALRRATTDGNVIMRQEDFFYHWNQAAESYSLCQLSSLKDKLPAIAGLAARFHQAIGSQYIAALWRDCLPKHLQWQVLTSSFQPHLIKEYLAPSFSWASIQGAEIFRSNSQLHSNLIEVQDVQTVLSGVIHSVRSLLASSA